MDRRWFLCPDAPAVCYAYEVCDKQFLGFCTKHKWVEERKDLTDPAVRKEFIDQGFTFISDRRFQ